MGIWDLKYYYKFKKQSSKVWYDVFPKVSDTL